MYGGMNVLFICGAIYYYQSDFNLPIITIILFEINNRISFNKSLIMNISECTL